jgi:hypothetical protein
VRPSRISQVTGEILTFVAFKATLLVISNQNESNAILFEDGIPVPNNQWQFNNATEIEITSGFNPIAVYTFNYHALIRLETGSIDLLVPDNNGNETWFTDYVAWNRHRSDIFTIRETTSIIFDTAFKAILPRRSDQNKLQTVITEDTGITKRTIPQASFSYIDSLTVRINNTEFNPDAIYSIEYNQRITDPSRVVGILAEVKSAASVFSLTTATYVPFGIKLGDNCVNGSLRFHQMRITLSNVLNISDARIHSTVLKGLNMSGVGSPPPGL